MAQTTGQALPHPPPAPIAGNLPLDPDWSMWFELVRDIASIARFFSLTLTPSSVSANTTSEQTFTVTGLKTADFVMVNKPSHQTGLGVVNCRVSAADTLAITFMNTTGSSITPTSEAYAVVALRVS